MAPRRVSCRPLVLVLFTFCLQGLLHVAVAAAVSNVTFVTACEEDLDTGPENWTLRTTSFIFLDGEKLANYSNCQCSFSSVNIINITTHRSRGIYAGMTNATVDSGTDPQHHWEGQHVQLLLSTRDGQDASYILLKVQGQQSSTINVICAKNSSTAGRSTTTSTATATVSSTAQSSLPRATAASADTSPTTTTALGASPNLKATHGQDSPATSPPSAEPGRSILSSSGTRDPGPSTSPNASASLESGTDQELQKTDSITPNMISTVMLAVGLSFMALALVIVIGVILANRRRRRRARTDSQGENAAGKPGSETKQPRPGGKGGRSRFRSTGASQPDPGAAALHSSRASLISEQHDYEDVSEEGLSQAQQQQQQQRDAPPSRKASKDSARGAPVSIPGEGEYSHFATSGSATGPRYIHASVNIPTKDGVEDGDYSKLGLRSAPSQSGPSGKSLTLPKTSGLADQANKVYGAGDDYARSPTVNNGEGDIYENMDEGREYSSGSRRRKPRKGEQKEKGWVGGEVAEDMYQDCISPKGGNRSLSRLGVSGGGGGGGGGDSFRLSPLLSRAGSWRLSWRRRNHGKGGQGDKTLADLDVRHLPLPRDPCGTNDDDENLYEIKDGPFGHPLPPRLPPSVSRVTNLRRNSSRSMDNVSRAVMLKVARDATRRIGLNRPKSMDLSQLELMPDSARSSFHSSRSQGDGAETLPRVVNDLNDEDDYEEIPCLYPPLPAQSSVPGSRTLGANTTLSPPSHSLPVLAADPVPQATSSQHAPARTPPRSRTSSEPPKASPRPERAAITPRVLAAPEAGEADVVLRRKSKAGSPTKVKVDKPPLPQDGKFSAEDQLKLLRINKDLLELQTAVRKSMEIHEDELIMVDNVLYGTLPRNSSQPTTEL